MTRRASLTRHPERVWVVWDLERRRLPTLLTVFDVVAPGLLAALLLGRRSGRRIVLFLCLLAVAAARLRHRGVWHARRRLDVRRLPAWRGRLTLP